MYLPPQPNALWKPPVCWWGGFSSVINLFYHSYPSRDLGPFRVVSNFIPNNLGHFLAFGLTCCYPRELFCPACCLTLSISFQRAWSVKISCVKCAADFCAARIEPTVLVTYYISCSSLDTVRYVWSYHWYCQVTNCSTRSACRIGRDQTSRRSWLRILMRTNLWRIKLELFRADNCLFDGWKCCRPVS